MAKNKVVREPIATWWRIHYYKPQIDSVPVAAFTAAFVTVLENAFSEHGPKVERRYSRENIFPSFGDAKQELLKRSESEVKRISNNLQSARSFHGQVQSLQEPEP